MTYLLAGHIALVVYAVLLAVGGVMGFVKAGSRPSLIAGLASAFGAMIAFGLSATGNVMLGWSWGLVLAIVLFVFFGYRFAKKNRVFMPNGLMAIVSLVVLAVLMLLLILTGGSAPLNS